MTATLTLNPSTAIHRQRIAKNVPKDYTLWRMSVAQYHAMIRAGILQDGEPIELLEGWLVQKMPKNPAHTTALQLTQQCLSKIVPAGYLIRAQEPITLAESEPEPDLAIVRGTIRNYQNRHPMAQDVELLIEVAEATLGRDRNSKKRIYAQAGIPIYWIVNLLDQQIEVYTLPYQEGKKSDYREKQIFHLNDHLLVTIAGQEAIRLPVSELLP